MRLLQGGSGSGNYGHKGRYGQKGGSAPTMSISQYENWAKQWGQNAGDVLFDAVHEWTMKAYKK